MGVVFGRDRIDQLLYSLNFNDLEDWPEIVNAALDEFPGEEEDY